MSTLASTICTVVFEVLWFLSGVGFVSKWVWKGAEVLMKQISKPKACSQGSTLYLGQLLVLHCSCQFMLICAYFIASGSSLGFSFVVYVKKQVPFMPERKHTDFLYVPSKYTTGP